MRILFIHERERGDGAIERTSSRFDQREVLVGRGGASHIILSHPRLSLVHAKLFEEDGRVWIADVDSFVGVRVNAMRVARHPLTDGDIIQFGDLSLQVSISEDGIVLTLRSGDEESLPESEIVARNARKIQVDTYLPSIRVLSFFLAVMVLAGCFAYPLLTGRYSGWSSGPVANAHRLIEHDCQRCHLTPFERVDDRECLSCHTMSEHAAGGKEYIARHQEREVRCAQCHMEHNGDSGLIVRDSRTCVACHADMQSKDGGALAVSSFATHPEFRISVSDESGMTHRVKVNDPQHAIDTTAIKFNHAVHLKDGLRGPQGPTTLQCNHCHRLSEDKKGMLPIRFDSDCRECHGLGFDERLPDSQLPHGDSEVVYPTLFAEYATLLLLKGHKGAPQQPTDSRVLPGAGDSSRETPSLSADAKLVQESARRAEEEVFTRTGCFLCHEFREKPLAQRHLDESRYTILDPRIPSPWMTGARFDHGAHEELSCESCHQKSRQSEETRDVLLPSIEVCRQCHMEGATPGFVESDCTQCHGYHSALEVPRQKKQNLTEFLHALTR